MHSAVKRDPWWCPIEIAGIGKPRLFAAAGEDSLQALVLALRAADAKLATGFRNAQIDWLGDAERPIFFHTHGIEMYEGAIDNLLAAVRKAIEVIEENPGAPAWKKSIAELRRIEGHRGFSRRARGSTRRRPGSPTPAAARR